MADGVRISLADKLAMFSDHWAPRLIETVDDYEIKLVKLQGDFVWHSHAQADELFLVLTGRLRMDFRDRQVDVGAGEIIVVPRGVEHKPFAREQCEILLLERSRTANTGDGPPNERTRVPETL
ncbi:MAG TPA: cupin domain-containing protein [Acetobacteraceae bacterium]|nr:cupin domain-containing protein [Acetobacteraceae bacterium]